MKFKVAIKNVEHSKQVQEAAFKMGFGWLSSDTDVRHTSEEALYMEDLGDGRKYITYSDISYFNSAATEDHPVYELVDGQLVPKGTKPKVYEFKIATINPENSRRIQEALFALGVKWAGKDNGVENTERDFLYIGSFGENRITQGNNREYFEKHELPEYEFIGGKFVPKGDKPVHVRTKEQVVADRRKELLDGVVAYHQAGMEVPAEWISELFVSGR